MTVAGTHTLDSIRLVDGSGNVLLHASPESVRIDVIDKLLVTQVIARPLTAAEIREKGLVFDKSSFQAFNFTAAFAVGSAGDQKISIDFPIVLPTLQGAAPVVLNQAGLPSIQAAVAAEPADDHPRHAQAAGPDPEPQRRRVHAQASRGQGSELRRAADPGRRS